MFPLDLTLKFMLQKILFSLLIVFLFADCKPDETEPEFVTILLRIGHKASGKELVKEELIYKDSAGQKYSITTFNYFISNIKLRNKEQNIFYQEVDSYHLVKSFLNPNNTEIILKNVPRKKFAEMELSIGVDSIANKNIDKLGQLDPGSDMIWNWEEGYKFFDFTGRYMDGTNLNPFVFHIGGNENYKTLTFSFPALLGNNYDVVKDGQIILEADASGILGSPNKVDFKVTNNVMSTKVGADKIAENYANGFLKLVGAN